MEIAAHYPQVVEQFEERRRTVQEENSLSCLYVDCYLCSTSGHVAVDCKYFSEIRGNLLLHGEQLKNKIRRMKSLIRKEARTAAPTASNSPKMTGRIPSLEKVYETEEEQKFQKGPQAHEADRESGSSSSDSSFSDDEDSKDEEANSESLEKLSQSCLLYTSPSPRDS